jgi:beta-glucosidase
VGLRRLRTAATRTLRLRLELGLFDGPANGPFAAWNSSNWVDTDAHRALARQSASESLILLRNEQELLPLNVSQLKHVAVIGPNANNTWALLSNYAGCGASQTRHAVNVADPSQPCGLVTPLQGLQLQLPPHVKLSYEPGSTLNTTLAGGIQKARSAAKNADIAILVVGLTAWPGGRFANLSKTSLEGSDPFEGEAHDRVDLRLTNAQRALVAAVLDAQPRTVLVLMSGGAISEPFMSGKGAAPVVIQAFYGGEELGNALAAHLLGHTAFSGRLPVTIVRELGQLPSYLSQQMSLPPGRTHRYLTEEPLYPFGAYPCATALFA